ncbi:MAG: hypothetical protein M1358_20230 [Chloroflexi bacterium]|nr:hypothetical protein [Chloroflexota bacterium]
MVSIVPLAGSRQVGKGQESLKPTELRPQQASVPTTCGHFDSNIEQVQAICQEFLGKFRENTDEICLSAYTAALSDEERAECELAIQQRELRQVEAELEALRQEVSVMAESVATATSAFSIEAEQSMAVLVQRGIVAPEEAERQIQSALVALQARLDEAGRESAMRISVLEEKVVNLRCLVEKSSAEVSSLGDRLADLQELPAVARHLAALEDARKRQIEQVKATIRFLRTAPWGELSRDRKITQKLSQAAALGNQNVAVFDALVGRLSDEMDRLGALPTPVAWSVIRVIAQLGLQDMFPDLAEKRLQLALVARAHKREKRARDTDDLPGKVVSLASRWGARLASPR